MPRTHFVVGAGLFLRFIGVNFVYDYPRLRDLREDADLTQRSVAVQLGITTQQYSLYERGDRESPFHHVITLAKFYRVSLDYIAGLTNRKTGLR